MTGLSWWGLPAVAILMALVELAKSVGFPSRYAGVLAVGLGVLGGVTAHYWGDSAAAEAVIAGIVAGLTAAGLWSASKAAAGR